VNKHALHARRLDRVCCFLSDLSRIRVDRRFNFDAANRLSFRERPRMRFFEALDAFEPQQLLQRSPPEFDDTLPTAYSQLLRLEGVERLEEAHSWTLAKGQTICSVKIKTTIDANPRKITQDATNAIKAAGVQRVFIHLN
jgi:hypothetical protein